MAQVQGFDGVSYALNNRGTRELLKKKKEEQDLLTACKNQRKMNRILHERLLQMGKDIEQKNMDLVSGGEDCVHHKRKEFWKDFCTMDRKNKRANQI